MGMKATKAGSDKEKEFEDLLREAKKHAGVYDVIQMYEKYSRLSKSIPSPWLKRPSITTTSETG